MCDRSGLLRPVSQLFQLGWQRLHQLLYCWSSWSPCLCVFTAGNALLRTSTASDRHNAVGWSGTVCNPLYSDRFSNKALFLHSFAIAQAPCKISTAGTTSTWLLLFSPECCTLSCKLYMWCWPVYNHALCSSHSGSWVQVKTLLLVQVTEARLDFVWYWSCQQPNPGLG